jgi:hypothetical protein
MLTKKLPRIILNFLLILTLLLAAGCGPSEAPDVEEPAAEAPAAEETEAPAADAPGEPPAEQPAPVKGDVYQHISGAFEMPAWGEVADEGSDYAFLENDLGQVLVVVAASGDELSEETAIDAADAALQDYLVALEILSSAQVSADEVQAINSGFALPYAGENASGESRPGLIYLRQDGGSRFVLLLLANELADAEGDFYALAEGFTPNPSSQLVDNAEADSGFRP